jgi:predicted secreted hydrolase
MKHLWILLFLCLSCSPKSSPPGKADSPFSAIEVLGKTDDSFEKASAPKVFRFPEDHFSHPSFKTEWWYWTGNLESGAKKFGYQLTFFRTSNARPLREGPWSTSETWMAHFAVSDASKQIFQSFERFERGGSIGLAGADSKDKRIFVHGWNAKLISNDPLTVEISAKATLDVGISLRLTASKPLVFQGDRGLSWKNNQKTNASYYYSSTRMTTEGTLQVGGQDFSVKGNSWLDREWSSGSLDTTQSGWDWFSIQMNDGTDVMLFRIREKTGAKDFRAGTLISPAGKSESIPSSEVFLQPSGQWTSPSGYKYPATWTVGWNSGRYLVRPTVADQELRLKFQYWEGAVQIESEDGKPVGKGFLEMTGYLKR